MKSEFVWQKLNVNVNVPTKITIEISANPSPKQLNAVYMAFIWNHVINNLHCYLVKQTQQSPLPDKRSSTRLTSPSSKSTVYPKECNLCNKYTIKIKGNRVVPVTISTMIATETVKAAAMKNNYDLY